MSKTSLLGFISSVISFVLFFDLFCRSWLFGSVVKGHDLFFQGYSSNSNDSTLSPPSACLIFSSSLANLPISFPMRSPL